LVLDSGEYRPFVVTDSVNITAAPGAYALILVSVPGGTAIDIQGGSRVVINGIHIANGNLPMSAAQAVIGLHDGVGANASGIEVVIEKCSFDLAGIRSHGAHLTIVDTVLRGWDGGNTADSGVGGLSIDSGTVTIIRSRLQFTSLFLFSSQLPARVTLRDSEIVSGFL